MTLLSTFSLITLLIINYIIYKKYDLSKTFFIISNIILFSNFLLIHILYYNNISLGFESGVAFGNLNGIYIDDEYRYFYESNSLYDIFKTNGVMQWFTRTLPPSVISPSITSPPYGFYNPFVFVLSLFRLLGFNHITELLTIKLVFVLINSYLIFEISSSFCKGKLKYLPLIIINFSPLYIMINITLCRDLIITTLILYILKFMILEDKNYKKLIIPIFFLFIFRSYVVICFLASILIVYRNTKKLFSLTDFIFIIVIFTSILIFLRVDIPIPKVVFLKNQLIELHGNSIFTPLNLTQSTIWDIFIKSPYLGLLKTSSFYCIMTSLSSLYYMVISLLFIIKVMCYIFSKKIPTTTKLIKFTIYFTLLNSYILMMRDGFITSRLTNIWFTLFVFIIFIPLQDFTVPYLKTKKTSS